MTTYQLPEGTHKSAFKGIGTWFGYALVAVVLISVLGLVAMMFRLPAMNIEREITQRSQGYTETKAALLRTLYTEYLDLSTKLVESQSTQLASALRAQQAGLIRRMKEQAALIPTSEIPSDIQAFLNTQGR